MLNITEYEHLKLCKNCIFIQFSLFEPDGFIYLPLQWNGLEFGESYFHQHQHNFPQFNIMQSIRMVSIVFSCFMNGWGFNTWAQIHEEEEKKKQSKTPWEQ